MNIKKSTCEFCGKEYEYDEDNIRGSLSNKTNRTYDTSKFCCPKCHYRYISKKSFETFRTNNPGVSSPCHLPGVQDKARKTMIEKYGTDKMSQSKEIIQKRKETCLRKYGTETPLANKDIRQKTYKSNIKNHNGIYYLVTEECRKLSTESHRTKESKQKSRENFDVQKKKQEMIAKYGVDNPFKLKEVQDQIKQTNVQKYGSSNPKQNSEVSSKASETRMLNKLINKSNFNQEYIKSKFITKENKFDLNSFSKYFGLTLHSSLHFKDKFNIALPDLVTHDNTLESKFCQYIQSITDKQVIRHERKLLDGKYEIDIYIPEMKLGFEFNGDYWHSENAGVSPNYHFMKSLACREKGIRLVHVWEHEWINDQEKIKIFLNSLFIPRQKIRASKCKLKEISSQEFLDFGEKYHLLGSTRAGTRIGLYYNNELVSAIGLSYSNKKDEWDLKRYIVGKYQIMGGFQKMFNHFIKVHRPRRIITFVELSKFNGAVDYKNGFVLDKVMREDFFWIVNNIRVDKWTAWKHFHIDGQSTSDYQSMMMNDFKFFKCYDAGKERLVWKSDYLI